MSTKTKTRKNTETGKRCDPKQVAIGDVYSRHSHGVVKALTASGLARLRNERGFEWTVSLDILAEEFSFADQHETTAKLSRTELIEQVLAHRRTAMTIVFTKKPDPKVVADKLAGGRAGGGLALWRKVVKEALAGEERTMVGYHTGAFDEHQRLRFMESGAGPRLVDLRTVSVVIVDRVRYEVK